MSAWPESKLTGEALAPAFASSRLFPRYDEQYCNAPYLQNVLEHRFEFVGESHQLSTPVDWLDNPSKDVEWHILLHKFYYAVGLARGFRDTGDQRLRDCFLDLVASWIDVTPPGFIATDVTGRRIQNWIYSWYLFRDTPLGLPRAFEARFLESIERQVEYILVHMAPAHNHRTLELYTVFLSGVAFPELPQAKRWREFARKEMCNNIESDLLADGVHCELSTDYHHIVLRNYLLFVRLARTNNIDLPSSIDTKLVRALEFAAFIHRPDGKIPALSDSDSRSHLDVLAMGADLFERADFAFVATAGSAGTAPVTKSRVFEAGGYSVLRSAWARGDKYRDARYLVFDHGAVGAGNHGHLDALSLELAAYGRPLVVDPGRYTYDESGDYNWRARFRGTLAHNTVTVNGSDQAIYRQKGQRKRIFEPHPKTELMKEDLNSRVGYLHGRTTSPLYDAVHDRHILFVDAAYWWVVDVMSAEEPHDYELGFQLNDDAQENFDLHPRGQASEIHSPHLTTLLVGPQDKVTVEPSVVSKNYGVKHDAPRVAARSRAANHRCLSLLYPFKFERPRVEVQQAGANTVIAVHLEAQVHHWIWKPGTGRLDLTRLDCSRSDFAGSASAKLRPCDWNPADWNRANWNTAGQEWTFGYGDPRC